MQATPIARRRIYRVWLLARLVCWEVRIRWERFMERRARERDEAVTRRRAGSVGPRQCVRKLRARPRR
jgi:hypothetical protein